MRRSPFYAYSNFPHSFYAPPAEASYRRPHCPFPPSSPAPSPAPAPRSVINVPVFDSAPSRPSSSPPHPQPFTSLRPASPAVPLIDPSSAATRIQSRFRGFCVRRHRPLIHLRSIAKARKQLEELQSELESPGFALKVRTNEKERLRFSESVMAIILRLDAIEGSMAEVRSQRKEATKMAIKLQDAIDAIMMQKDDIVALKPTACPFSDGGMAPNDESVLCEQSQESLCPYVNMVQQGGGNTFSEEGIMGANTTQEKSTLSEDDVADKCMPDLDKDDDVMDTAAENVSPLHPLKMEVVDQQSPGCLESVAKLLYDTEQDMSHIVTGENAGSDATHTAEEEVNNGLGALHLDAHHMQNNAFVAKVKQDSSVDNTIVADHDSAKAGSYTCMDVVQEVKVEPSQDVELCPGTPTAEEKNDYPHYNNAAHQNQLQDPSTVERLRDGNCSSDVKYSSISHGYENCNDAAHENPSDEAISCEELKARSSAPSMVGIPSPHDSAILQQLSEDCKQLKSLVGKLLVQNKAQSNVLCALGERLELLEQQQQQLNCQHNQQKKTREKRKLKKGSKRSVKCRNCE